MISEKFQSMILWIWEQLALFLSVLYHLPNDTFQYLGYNVEDEDDNYEEMQSNKQGSVDDADNVLSSRRLSPRKKIAKDSHKSKNDPKHDRRKSSSTVSRYLHQSEEKVETQLITENNFGWYKIYEFTFDAMTVSIGFLANHFGRASTKSTLMQNSNRG